MPAHEYLDALLRRQIGLTAVSNGITTDMLAALDGIEPELRRAIEKALARITRRGAVLDASTRKRLDALERALRDLLAGPHREAREALLDALEALARDEADFQVETLQEHLQDLANWTPPPAALLAGIVAGIAIEGRRVVDWARDLAATDVQRIMQAVRRGLSDGLTDEQIVLSIFGTRRLNFTDGVRHALRRGVQTLTRTAVVGVSTEAREAVYRESGVKRVRWVSTLDGRTSSICRARDGRVYPIDDGPRPPAHPRCRSIIVAEQGLSDDAPGRPFVRSTKSLSDMYPTYRRLAKERVGEARWRALNAKQRYAEIKRSREAWQARNVGQVTLGTSYAEWFARQPAGFQREVLGPSRFALFKAGRLKLDRFVDLHTGKRYTLAELRRRERTAWRAADLEDPR